MTGTRRSRRRSRHWHRLSFLALLVLVWLLLSGHFDPLLLSFGAISVSLAAWIAHRMYVVDHEAHPIHVRTRAILAFWGWLLVEIVKSNIDVARRVLHPRLPITPTVVRVPCRGFSELAQVIYANSITLTPGTVSMNLGQGEIEVHALTRDAAQALLAGEMARRLQGVDPPQEGDTGE